MNLEPLLELVRGLSAGASEKPDPGLVHAAAAGLVNTWYRNTEGVEGIAHKVWTDADMLRMNARATEHARRALQDVIARPLEVEMILTTLLDELLALLPSKDARDALYAEKGAAPEVASRWVAEHGLVPWLVFLSTPLCAPSHWWGTSTFPALVDQYCSVVPGPPDPDTFRHRMLEAPWELSDEQARFVIRHRGSIAM